MEIITFFVFLFFAFSFQVLFKKVNHAPSAHLCLTADLHVRLYDSIYRPSVHQLQLKQLLLLLSDAFSWCIHLLSKLFFFTSAGSFALDLDSILYLLLFAVQSRAPSLSVSASRWTASLQLLSSLCLFSCSANNVFKCRFLAGECWHPFVGCNRWLLWFLHLFVHKSCAV